MSFRFPINGDIFPLLTPDNSAWWQRLLATPPLDNSGLGRVRRVFFGLNALNAARPNFAFAPHAAAGPRPSVAQRGLLCRIVRRVRLYEASPLGFEPEACASQMLASKGLYPQEHFVWHVCVSRSIASSKGTSA